MILARHQSRDERQWVDAVRHLTGRLMVVEAQMHLSLGELPVDEATFCAGMTLPLITALETCQDSDRQLLTGLLENTPEERKKSLSLVRDLIEKYNGFSYSRKKAQMLIEEASKGLSLFHDCPEKEILLGLGQYVLKRNK